MYVLRSEHLKSLIKSIYKSPSSTCAESQGDHILFTKHFSEDKLTLLLVYVDDMISVGDDEHE